jgi:hypothetical protein
MAAGWTSIEIAEAIEHPAVADRRGREENAALDACCSHEHFDPRAINLN